jgi:multiple antibiotic resistance protein
MNIFEVINQATALFVILNSIGQIPLFISILRRYNPKQQRNIIIRELCIALGILFSFAFFGDEILKLLGITGSILGIAGGILLFLIALSMVFPKDDQEEGLPKHEPMIVPLAIPAIAGPGSIATVMLFSTRSEPVLSIFLTIMFAWIPSLIILLAASYIRYALGDKGLSALQRLGGMIVCLIGIQMFCTGVVELVRDNFSVGSTKSIPEEISHTYANDLLEGTPQRESHPPRK